MIKLMEHQQKALELSRTEPNLALFWEMGTGKTIGLISILLDVYKREGNLRTLILAPPIVLEQWRGEFAKLGCDKEICVLSGTGKKKIKTLLETKADIIITNYHALQNLELYRNIMAWRPKVLVCDESHYLKSHKSKRSKYVMDIAKRTVHRYLLTGTPMPNSLMDIFQQFKILDSGATFGRLIGRFQQNFFVNKNANRPGCEWPDWQAKHGSDTMIASMIRPKSIVVKKEECLDLPELVKQKVMVELSGEQKRLYKELKKDFLAYIQNESEDSPAVVAKSAAEKAIRLQQIVTGYVKTDCGLEAPIEGKEKNPRTEALRDLCASIPPTEKAIIWSNFRYNYKQIKEVLDELGFRYAEVHGDIKDKDAQVALFKKDPKVRFLVSNPASGGVGLNLCEASYSIYFSRSFNLEHFLQSEARNYRKGSEIHNHITHIDIVAPGTIDSYVMKALERKENIMEYVLKLTKEDI